MIDTVFRVQRKSDGSATSTVLSGKLRTGLADAVVRVRAAQSQWPMQTSPSQMSPSPGEPLEPDGSIPAFGAVGMWLVTEVDVIGSDYQSRDPTR